MMDLYLSYAVCVYIFVYIYWLDILYGVNKYIVLFLGQGRTRQDKMQDSCVAPRCVDAPYFAENFAI